MLACEQPAAAAKPAARPDSATEGQCHALQLVQHNDAGCFISEVASKNWNTRTRNNTQYSILELQY